MLSVQSVVNHFMNERPFVQECLNQSLINYNALAKQLKPDIETELQKEVNLLTISMALRRYAKRDLINFVKQVVIDPDTELTSKSNLVEFTFIKSSTLLTKLNSFSEQIQIGKGDVFSVIHGINNVSLLTNTRHTNTVEYLIASGEEVINKLSNIGAIFMLIPQQYRVIPGFFYYLSRNLSFHNINIYSMLNVDTEVLFLFKEVDVPRALQVLQNLIPNHQP